MQRATPRPSPKLEMTQPWPPLFGGPAVAADRITAELEGPQTCRLGITRVGVRDSEGRHRSAGIRLLGLRIVFEVAEAEVGQQRTR